MMTNNTDYIVETIRMATDHSRRKHLSDKTPGSKDKNEDPNNITPRNHDTSRKDGSKVDENKNEVPGYEEDNPIGNEEPDTPISAAKRNVSDDTTGDAHAGGNAARQKAQAVKGRGCR